MSSKYKSQGELKLDTDEATIRITRPQDHAARAYANLQDLPSPSGRLSDRIERLRQRCTEALGKEVFRDAYSFLKQHEEVDSTSSHHSITSSPHVDCYVLLIRLLPHILIDRLID